MFDTVDDLLRSIIGYVHGTGHGLVPHIFSGSRFVTEQDWGTTYHGFRAPITGRRWAISSWKMIHSHNVDPNDSSEFDVSLDESNFNFVVAAMCTMEGQRRLASMARTQELDRLLAMRKVMNA